MEENKLTRNNVNTVLIAIDYDPSAQKVAETG
jgi:hypothetical protein